MKEPKKAFDLNLLKGTFGQTGRTIEDILIDITHDIQYQNHSGYEINEGGAGQITYQADGNYFHKCINYGLVESPNSTSGTAFEVCAERKFPSL